MSKHKFRNLQLGLAACLGLACAPCATAEEFSLMIGRPVAAQNFRAKSSVFALRMRGCLEPAKAEVVGTAEGLVDGERRTIRLEKIAAMPTPGVHVVFREWPAEGVWAVNVKAHCGAATAGALVPIGPKGFLRESSKFFPRTATEEEIEDSLKSLAAVMAEHSPGTGK